MAIAVAVGAIMAGVIESGRASASDKASLTRATGTASLEVRRQTTSPKTVAAVPSPTPTPTPTPAARPTGSAPTASVPGAPQYVEAPAPALGQTVPAQPPTLAPQPRNSCPSGSVTAALDSITFEWPYSTLPNEVTIVGRGTLHNGSSAAIRISERDVPNLYGLDSKGRIATIELYGEYDWAPPPGIPSGGTSCSSLGKPSRTRSGMQPWHQ